MKIAIASCLVLAAACCGQQQCASLNGSGYVMVPHSNDLIPSGGITVEAWVFRNPAQLDYRIIVQKDQAYVQSPYTLRTENDGLGWIVRSSLNGTQYGLQWFGTLGLGWHHVAATYDNNLMKLYVDGVQVGPTVATLGPLYNSGTGELHLGNGTLGSPGWVGSLEEVRIWGYARSAQQIAAARFFQITAEAGLVSSWRFNGDLLDSIGGHHGTVVGPWGGLISSSAPLTPYLAAPSSAAIGTVINYDISLPAWNALAPYVFDVSVNGTSPGFAIPGSNIVVPLNPPFLHYESGGVYPSVFVNCVGLIDLAGSASPAIAVPNQPWMVGYVLSGCFVTLDSYALGSIGIVSDPVSTSITGGPTP